MSNDPVARAAGEVVKLAALLIDARELQWSAAPVPKPRDDTDRKATGGHGDPTADTALDDRRLALRRACRDAEEELQRLAAAAEQARAALSDSLEHWKGEG